MRLQQSAEIAATPEILFDLTQDYGRRLDWDSYLKEARLIDAKRPGVGVHAWCVATNGFGMETRYVSFRPPSACAVEMVRGPWLLKAFSGSWRFEPVGPCRTRVEFIYSLAGRPAFLTRVLAKIFDHDTRRRLAALRRAAEVL